MTHDAYREMLYAINDALTEIAQRFDVPYDDDSLDAATHAAGDALVPDNAVTA